MEARVVIGANRTFVLKNAILLYGDGTSIFATLHSVMMQANGGAPHLGPGQALTTAFLKTLSEGLGAPHSDRNSAGEYLGAHARHDHLVDARPARSDVFRRRGPRGARSGWRHLSAPCLGLQGDTPGTLRARFGEG